MNIRKKKKDYILYIRTLAQVLETSIWRTTNKLVDAVSINKLSLRELKELWHSLSLQHNDKIEKVWEKIWE